MLYDNHSRANTPFIPPLPSPKGIIQPLLYPDDLPLSPVESPYRRLPQVSPSPMHTADRMYRRRISEGWVPGIQLESPSPPESPYQPLPQLGLELLTPEDANRPLPLSEGSVPVQIESPSPPESPNQPLPQPELLSPEDANRPLPASKHMDSFAEGPHYGPVLDPFLAKIVGAVINLNPLLAPPYAQYDHLRWNMLFDASNCYRTTEPRPWTGGGNAPATHPRLSHIQIIARSFPWVIDVHARHAMLAITCGDVLDAISVSLHRNVAEKEYECLPPARKQQVRKNFRFNRLTDFQAPAGRLGEGLKRLDWLGRSSRFGGLVANDAFVVEHCGDVLPCTFELKCLSSYPLTVSEPQRQIVLTIRDPYEKL